MRWIWLVFLGLPGLVSAQTTDVFPGELALSVEVEETDHIPFVREMVLITIRGIYRRHITRETLIQPDLDGFSWSQLGADLWREERLDGKLVKVFERRMALYPDRPGQLTIGPFRHALTLTDEGDDWFEHEIASTPLTLAVAPAPQGSAWFFPARDLKVTDQWSNAPDQLQPGEGVLRVVRLEALGVTPEMIPPMPDLTSPSGIVFPHPEKRLVELTPDGPITYAFWRWTIRPSNDVSTIVEPIRFNYYNTTERQGHEVTIGAQRIAYGALVPQEAVQPTLSKPTRLPGIWQGIGALVLCLCCVAFGLRQTQAGKINWPSWLWFLDQNHLRLRGAAKDGSLHETRRAATALLRRDTTNISQHKLLAEFDRKVFARARSEPDLRQFARDFRKATTPHSPTKPADPGHHPGF